jgi:hypothetical protein
LPTMASSQAFDAIIETTSSSTTTYNSCSVDWHEDKFTHSKEPTRANKSLIVAACSHKGRDTSSFNAVSDQLKKLRTQYNKFGLQTRVQTSASNGFLAMPRWGPRQHRHIWWRVAHDLGPTPGRRKKARLDGWRAALLARSTRDQRTRASDQRASTTESLPMTRATTTNTSEWLMACSDLMATLKATEARKSTILYVLLHRQVACSCIHAKESSINHVPSIMFQLRACGIL